MSRPYSTGGLSGATGAGGLRPSTWDLATALPEDALTKARRLLLALGILSLIAGAAAILVPIVASVTMTIFIGWLLMLFGVMTAIETFRSDDARGQKAWRALNALLSFVVGFYLVALPLSGTITLTFLLSVWFFGTGVFSLLAAWQLRGRPGWGWAAANGVLAVIGGLLIALSLPASAAWAIGLVVGIYMIWWGIDALAASALLKRVSRDRA
jgi:uncharacterized membrane protein HdeD (DUF308 family)